MLRTHWTFDHGLRKSKRTNQNQEAGRKAKNNPRLLRGIKTPMMFQLTLLVLIALLGVQSCVEIIYRVQQLPSEVFQWPGR